MGAIRQAPPSRRDGRRADGLAAGNAQYERTGAEGALEMSLRIVPADERARETCGVTLALLGRSGIGKTLFVDLDDLIEHERRLRERASRPFWDSNHETP